VIFKYLSIKYVKFFLIFLVGVCLLFVLVDYIYNVDSLPNSSNLQILYLFYKFVYASFIMYPLALVFSFLLILNNLIKFNELVSFYSLGFKPKKLLFPFLAVAFSIFVFFSFLQSTKISYANQYAKAIQANMNLKNSNLFLKYQNFIVYFKSLNPIVKHAYDIRIFELKNDAIVKVIFAKRAVFRNDKWECKRATVLTLKKDKWEKSVKDVTILKNFKPKIISNLKMLNNISFYDAYITLKYFKDVDLNKILSIVFFKIFTPLSMILLIVLFFYLAPIHFRFSNLTLFMVKSLIFTILVWGIMLLIFKFSKQGILPFYVIVIPFVILLIMDLVIVRRKNDRL